MDKKTMAVGTPVRVRRDNGDVLETVTRSEPWLMGGHSWMVMVEGIAGGYALHRVDPLVTGGAVTQMILRLQDEALGGR